MFRFRPRSSLERYLPFLQEAPLTAQTITPAATASRVEALAAALDYLTEQDLCALCSITPSTAEAWRKRRKGPAYALVGNRVLYPKAGVREFLDSHVRAALVGSKELL
ncbi:helix-turn-helix domain-containing protein [Ramlibacter henchirensis]|uniref:helix-turn-helix domain-containing protein n=1 Tax=Ramlibacter henchirensis TaxID=204072 RepID=UPI003B84617C